MNKQRAQVFIATTKGLVQVQSIVRLNDPDLHSVITISNTSQLAGISRAYQDYVDKPQGVISDLFGGNAYRLNLSHGIDQGESWQLGVFIAHYLFELDCLSVGASEGLQANSNEVGDARASDIIFIATGRVDTLHYRVLPIDELAKKCLYANPNIARWQSQQAQFCFLAPAQNFRQAIPNTLVKLTPVAHLSELSQLFSLYGLPTQTLPFSDSIAVSANEKVENFYDIDERKQSVIIEASLVVDDAAHIDDIDNKRCKSAKNNPNELGHGRHEPECQVSPEASPPYNYFVRRLPLVLYTLIAAVFIWSLFNLLSSLFASDEFEIQSESKANFYDNAIEYIVAADISQNTASCSSAGNILITHGTLALDTQSNATNLDNLCGLFMVTSPQIRSLWLVSDTKAIIDLKGFKINAETFAKDGLLAIKQMFGQQERLTQWAVPIPKNKVQTRTFILLAFVNAADEADLSSLDSYLYKLRQQERGHDMSDLQTWIDKTQSDNKVFMVEQELTVYR